MHEGWKGLKTFSCTTLKPFGVADDNYQNFSLQHDPPSAQSLSAYMFFYISHGGLGYERILTSIFGLTDT